MQNFYFYLNNVFLGLPRHDEPQAAPAATSIQETVFVPANLDQQIMLILGIGLALVLVAGLLTAVLEQP